MIIIKGILAFWVVMRFTNAAIITLKKAKEEDS